MTNSLIMTAILSTNWSGVVRLQDDGSPHGLNKIESAGVYRFVTFHTMEGTNRINWGCTQPIKVGAISKTNGVLGPIVWEP